MRLVLRQSFPLGRFHATPWRINPFDDPYGEWPPSPWRLTRAVVARWYQWRRETVGHLARGRASKSHSSTMHQRLPFLFAGASPPVDHSPPISARGVRLESGYEESCRHQVLWDQPHPRQRLVHSTGRETCSGSSRVTVGHPNLPIVLDRCLERIVYFGRAEALTRICRTD